MIPIIGDVINAVRDLAGKAIVDRDKKIEFEYKLQELEDQANARFHEANMGQVEINKIEAASTNWFVAGWRPFIGWVSGFGVGWTFVFSPFAEFIARLFGWMGTMPVLDTGQLMVLVTSMLGLGAMRSFDKMKGTDLTTKTVPKEEVVKQDEPEVVAKEPVKKKKWRL